VSSLPNTYPTASRLRFEPGPSAPESSTLTTQLPSHPQLANKVYLSDVTVANISESFTHKMTAKTSWHRHE